MELKETITEMVKEAVLNGAFSDTNSYALENCGSLAQSICNRIAEDLVERAERFRERPISKKGFNGGCANKIKEIAEEYKDMGCLIGMMRDD